MVPIRRSSPQLVSASSRIGQIDGHLVFHTVNGDRFGSRINGIVIIVNDIIIIIIPGDIAKLCCQGVSAGDVRESLDFMTKAGLLKKDRKGNYTQTDKALRGDSEVMPVAIRSMHRDMAKFAVAAVDDFAISDRNFQGVTMGVDRETYEQITRELDAFRRRIVTIANSSKKVKQVYRLNLQLFPLSWPVPEETDA